MALFSIVLALMLSGSWLSNSLDRLQHASGTPAAHEHSLFSAISSIEAGECHTHESGDDTGSDGSSDHLPNSHHHHGDSGTAMASANCLAEQANRSSFRAYATILDRQTPRGVNLGPDRPPKPQRPSI